MWDSDIGAYLSMAPDFIQHCAGGLGTMFVYGGAAVVLVIGVFLFVSESSSGVRPPGCQRGQRKPVQ